MDALLTLNIFAQSLPAALIGMGLFGGLVALPWLLRHEPDAHHDEACPPVAAALL